MRGAAFLVVVSSLFVIGTSRSALLADKPGASTAIEDEIKPVIRSVEKAFQGKPDRPVEELVTEEATFQGLRPLREALRESAGKVKPFPPESKSYWINLSKLQPEERSAELVPEGVDPDKSVLYYRDLDVEEDRRFRGLFWLSKVGDRWMLVYGADGWMATEPLASMSRELIDDARVKRGRG